MKTAVVSLSLLVLATALMGQNPVFTYQGRFTENGQPFTGVAEMQFTLWDASSAGGSVATNAPPSILVGVTNGLFAAALDFGAAAFDGSHRWLQAEVRTSLGPFTTLNPRSRITAAPYAIRSANLTGILGSGNLAGEYVNAITLNHSANRFVGAFSGQGGGLSNVNAATLGGLSAGNFWQPGGNSVAAGQFLGSTNSQPLELRTGGRRALLLDPTFTTSNHSNLVNVVSGSAVNFVTPGFVGATIGGGGAARYFAFSRTTNSISTDFGTIAGGAGNIVNGIRFGTVGGGYGNSNNAYMGTIAGGNQNTATGSEATVAGGGFNVSDGAYSTVGGGLENVASGAYAIVAGGILNVSSNTSATVGGGEVNLSGGAWATVSGGGYNTNQGYSGTIGGGYQNFCGGQGATLAGGERNTCTNWWSTLGGGNQNTCIGPSSTVSGGEHNTNSGAFATISGGERNVIIEAAATIGGGAYNFCGGQFATVSGGVQNVATNHYATVGGGASNTNIGLAATIPGGLGNTASGQYSFAAGRRSTAAHDAAFVWAGGTTTNYSSTDPSTFNVYAANGASFDYGSQRGDGRGNRWFYVGPLNAGSTVTAWNGARLTDGGVWSNASDKHRKTDFQEMDARLILERLAALPVRQWRYTNENAGVKHLGPTAQDFRAAFGLGTDNLSIGTVDADGVALSAIQGLNRKVEEKEAQIEQLKKRLDTLERLLDKTFVGDR